MQRQYEQMRVGLDEILFNDDNPREEMGDLEALARSFADNGGEPINPPIVARDGEGYRLFDGERRVRAMKLIGTQTCTVLCYSGFLSAQAAVASMATDQKLRLNDRELARGFQTCFEAGVSDEEASAATGLEVEKVRRVRRVAKDAPGQTSLGAMLVAAEFDDPEDRKKIMASSYPDAAASQIRRERKSRENFAKIRAALVEAGVPEDAISDGPADSDKTEGLEMVGQVDKPKYAADLAKDYDFSHASAWMSGSLYNPGYVVYLPADEVPAKEDPYRSAQLVKSRLNDIVADCRADAASWVVSDWRRLSTACDGFMAAVVRSRGKLYLYKGFDTDGDGWAHMSLVSKPSMYEVVEWVLENLSAYSFSVDYSDNTIGPSLSAERSAKTWDVLTEAGWRAPEGTPSEIRAALTDEAVLGQLVAKVGGEADGDAR